MFVGVNLFALINLLTYLRLIILSPLVDKLARPKFNDFITTTIYEHRPFGERA